MPALIIYSTSLLKNNWHLKNHFSSQKEMLMRATIATWNKSPLSGNAPFLQKVHLTNTVFENNEHYVKLLHFLALQLSAAPSLVYRAPEQGGCNRVTIHLLAGNTYWFQQSTPPSVPGPEVGGASVPCHSGSLARCEQQKRDPGRASAHRRTSADQQAKRKSQRETTHEQQGSARSGSPPVACAVGPTLHTVWASHTSSRWFRPRILLTPNRS